MKAKIIYGKIQGTILFILISTIFIAACNGFSRPEIITEEVLNKESETLSAKKLSDNDFRFMAKAAELSLEEIQLGQLAAKISLMTDVKVLGTMMENTHSHSLQQINSIAKSKKAILPSVTSDYATDVFQRLGNKTGIEFDIECCRRMIITNSEAINAYEKASKETEDSDIKELTGKTLPVLRQHMDFAISCQLKCERMQ